MLQTASPWVGREIERGEMLGPPRTDVYLAMERPTIPPWSSERQILSVCNNLFTLVFTLEMAMKVEIERSMIIEMKT